MVIILMVDPLIYLTCDFWSPVITLLRVVCALYEFSYLVQGARVYLILLLGDSSFILNDFGIQFIVEFLLSFIVCSQSVLFESHFAQREREGVIFIPL